MQFTIIARDDTTEGTLQRRLAIRETHMQQIHAMKAAGTIIDGGALLNEKGEMAGSIILCEFPDKEALQNYLNDEIYYREKVWKDIEILPFRRVQWHPIK